MTNDEHFPENLPSCLSAEEIQTLVEVLERPANWGGYETTNLWSYETHMRVLCTSDVITRPSMDRAMHNKAYMDIFSFAYPDLDLEDLERHIELDVATYAELESADYHPLQLLESNWELTLKPFIFGTTETWPVVSKYIYVSKDEPSPRVADRIEKGLPRSLQLVASASILGSIAMFLQDVEDDARVATNFLTECFHLSDTELQAVGQMAYLAYENDNLIQLFAR